MALECVQENMALLWEVEHDRAITNSEAHLRAITNSKAGFMASPPTGVRRARVSERTSWAKTMEEMQFSPPCTLCY